MILIGCFLGYSCAIAGIAPCVIPIRSAPAKLRILNMSTPLSGTHTTLVMRYGIEQHACQIESRSDLADLIRHVVLADVSQPGLAVVAVGDLVAQGILGDHDLLHV